jgi:TatD DNase family protein
MWIDTHCHLDAAEFAPDRLAVREAARALGVSKCLIPAVEVANFAAVRACAQTMGDSYALGIHPLYVPAAQDNDLDLLDEALTHYKGDPHLVAVGEIGLDFFVPALTEPLMRERQEFFYAEQLKLARKHGLPVVLHVRRSADRLLKGLRQVAVMGGIAHAFNGSEVQAKAFMGLGFALGFGGALTFERATQLRRLAMQLPLEALVLETDAPDIPPQWLYRTVQARADGLAQGRNAPDQLPRMAALLAQLRGMSAADLALATSGNACRVVPRLGLPASGRRQSSP